MTETLILAWSNICYNIDTGKGKARAMDEREDEMNNAEFETLKRLILLQIEKAEKAETLEEARRDLELLKSALEAE